MTERDENIGPLSQAEALARLEVLGGGWQLNDAGHLEQQFKFSDFMGAMNFANAIGVEAEAACHHPDLYIAWGQCRVEIWTHDIGGLAEGDFALAAAISQLYPST